MQKKNVEDILTSFADLDWIRNKHDRKSITGNLFKLGNTSILWLTQKQNYIALSSAEAGYDVSATNALKTQLGFQIYF